MMDIHDLGKLAGSALAIITFIALVLGYVVQLYKLKEELKRHDLELVESREADKLILMTLLAMCRREKEKGANGVISEAINNLEYHLFERAHK